MFKRGSNRSSAFPSTETVVIEFQSSGSSDALSSADNSERSHHVSTPRSSRNDVPPCDAGHRKRLPYGADREARLHPGAAGNDRRGPTHLGSLRSCAEFISRREEAGRHLLSRALPPHPLRRHRPQHQYSRLGFEDHLPARAEGPPRRDLCPVATGQGRRPDLPRTDRHGSGAAPARALLLQRPDRAQPFPQCGGKSHLGAHGSLLARARFRAGQALRGTRRHADHDQVPEHQAAGAHDRRCDPFSSGRRRSRRSAPGPPDRDRAHRRAGAGIRAPGSCRDRWRCGPPHRPGPPSRDR